MLIHKSLFCEIYLHIRNKTGCFEKWSFSKAGLYCTFQRDDIFLYYKVMNSFDSTLYTNIFATEMGIRVFVLS